jgi:threonylcarbamoyladenosine tRNA methylthiotransferase MtaB
MATFAVKFLGCKVSQADVMLARQALLAAGHVEVPESEADVHVVNTCCITGEAESKSRQSVRRSLRTAGEVFVAGCAANLNAQQFADIDARVMPLVGTADEVAAALGGPLSGLACADLKHSVLATPRNHLRDGRDRALKPPERPDDVRQSSYRATERPQRSDGVRRSWYRATELPQRPDDPSEGWYRVPESRHVAAPPAEPAARTRGFVKVQDGCDCHCAYCIIPTVRGVARSRPAGAVLREVRERVRSGQPEMVMTGISVGDYRDPEAGLELGELMVQVARVPGVERVRLSSVEVIHVKDSLLEALATEPKVCPHLHVPMQSGDDEVLRAMGRHYSASEYLDQIAVVRAAAPRVNVTTDVIVGFPSEDDRAFQRTLDAVDAAGITRVHVFPYSPRPGTAAQALGDRVSPQEKKRRSQTLRGRAEVRSRHHRAAKLDTSERVLVDKVAETQCSGYTADYTRCYLPPGAAARGGLVDARCVELQADGIRCELPRDGGVS